MFPGLCLGPLLFSLAQRSHPLPQTSVTFCLLRILQSISPDFLDFSPAPNPHLSAERPTGASHVPLAPHALPTLTPPSIDCVGSCGRPLWRSSSNACTQGPHPEAGGVSSPDAFDPTDFLVHPYSFPSHSCICPVLSGLAAMPWVRSLMLFLSPSHPPTLHTEVRSQKSKFLKVHPVYLRAAPRSQTMISTNCALSVCQHVWHTVSQHPINSWAMSEHVRKPCMS